MAGDHSCLADGRRLCDQRDQEFVSSRIALRGDTSVQLNISNPLTGGRARPELARQGMIVEYMDRATGPTGDFFTQSLHTTYTRPAS